MQKWPLLTALCGIVLLLTLGLVVLEVLRAHRLDRIDAALAPLKPEHAIETLSDLKNRIDLLNEDMETLRAAFADRDLLKELGAHLARFENRSRRNTFGDYHMQQMGMVFGETPSLEASVATRLGSGESVQNELKGLFPAPKEPPLLEGPLPAQEETPPEGMAPLVLFKIKGDLR